MPDTFQALAVLVAGLLPGALYVWGFEREAGRWGISAADRVFRFIGVSSLLHAAALPISWTLWHAYVRTGHLQVGAVNWRIVWALGLLYVGAPVLAGSLVGSATRRGATWVRLVAGRHPAPRGWDHLFAAERPGWVRLRMKSGIWVGGLFANVGELGAYAAGYPDDQDLFLSVVAAVEQDTGEFVVVDGNPVLRFSGLLVRWDEVEYLEFTPASSAQTAKVVAAWAG